MPKLKMHIVLRSNLTAEQAVIASSHCSLGTYLHYQYEPLTQEWLKTSFIKIIHKASSEEQWEWCRTSLGDCRIFTESSLGNYEVSIGYKITNPDNPLFREVPLWNLS
jgi:hypothetical protein